MDNNRRILIDEFIEQAGWAGASREDLPLDASTRSYHRLSLNDRVAILMNAPPLAEGATCPVNADVKERAALGYNAVARLAGPNLNAFTQLSRMLCEADIHAPEIYADDPENGLALIEDLGSNIYADYIIKGGDEELLYQKAIDVLVHLHSTPVSYPSSPEYTLLEYDAAAMMAEVDLLPEWYWPHFEEGQIDSDLREEWRKAWQVTLQRLSNPSVFVMRDYHAENLLWLPEGDGISKVGVIDFQDGLIGHPAYDMASLLEDARRDVAPEIAAKLIDYYLDRMSENKSDFDRVEFLQDYRILAAQRNAKILGIFARLIDRDGKEKYRSFFPRVEKYFQNDLLFEELTPIREWCAQNLKRLVS